jgi:hypothetical protein
MIQRKPQHRLGANGIHEIKNHVWLRDFPWKDLENKKIVAPFKPPRSDNFDEKNINEEWRDIDDDSFKENLRSLRKNSVQSCFADYYFDHQLEYLKDQP